MPTILVETVIKAPIDRCYDLARSIELHQDGANQTQEKAIAGRSSGLIDLGETVTWKAKHFGIWQKLKVEITASHRPTSFTDRMLKGAFKSMRHLHTFRTEGDFTIMQDDFYYESPLGALGKLADWLFLEKYMTTFLVQKNQLLKEVAEGEEWKKYLQPRY